MPVLVAGCTATQPTSDWERQNEGRLRGEETLVLPSYPKKANLIEFYVSPTAEFKYYVDAASVSVGRDRIVRYVLVARSPEGVENVRYEGIRCPDQHRIYATARPDGSWSNASGPWRTIARGTALGSPYALARYFFCPHRDPIITAAEGVDALRLGSHPSVYVEQRNLGGSE